MRRPNADLRPDSAAFSYYPPLSAVADYVRAHLTGRITLAVASRVARLERKYFSTYFRSKVGISFSEWLRLQRVTRAKELMETGDASIPDVAFACGFRHVRTFERVFKRFVGVPPAVYRASVRPESRQMSQTSRRMPQGTKES